MTPRRRAARRLALAALLLGALGSGQARAWDSPEHVAIARSAYRRACKILHEQATAPEDKRRAATVCGADPSLLTLAAECHGGESPTNMERLQDGTPPLQPPFAFAERITQGAALAGDYFGTPDEFDTIEADRRLPSLISYLYLASDNADHFYPRVVVRAQEELVAATRLADEAHGAPRLPPAEAVALNRAGVHLMFALHYAQDAFAAGHMGINRAGSSAGPSQRLHGAFNNVGRTVVNGKGETLFLLGDQRYCEMDQLAKEQVVAVSEALIVRALGTYVFGGEGLAAAPWMTADLKDPSPLLPAFAEMAPALAYHPPFGGFVIAYTARPQLHSLSGIAGSARQSVSLGAGAIWEPGRLFGGLSGWYIKARPQEAILDWGFVAAAYTAGKTYRADAGLGARIGFLGVGVATFEACLRAGIIGGFTAGDERSAFLDARLQLLIELGEVLYLRVGGGAIMRPHVVDSRPVDFAPVAIVDIGYLIGAYGGSSLDVRNISRGF